jgi:hypothetical protein
MQVVAALVNNASSDLVGAGRLLPQCGTVSCSLYARYKSVDNNIALK